MGKLDQIKAKILEMEGGAFHRLCDDLLFKKGYDNINSIGMMQTTDRVITGTPDSLLIQPDGHYIFSEYTVQQNSLKNKINDDIDKCLNLDKTGISPKLISEIIVCYTGQLSTCQISELRTKCSQAGVEFTPTGLDAIALNILHRYPILAENHLGISLDTGQLLSISDFVDR